MSFNLNPGVWRQGDRLIRHIVPTVKMAPAEAAVCGVSTSVTAGWRDFDGNDWQKTNAGYRRVEDCPDCLAFTLIAGGSPKTRWELDYDRRQQATSLRV